MLSGGKRGRSLATDILAKYAADQPDVLADLLMAGDDKQFAVIYPIFHEQGTRGLPVMIREIDKNPAANAADDAKEMLAKRQANAAVALLRMNQPARVWPLLKHNCDPRVRSYLIHRLSPLGADAGVIRKHLDEEADVTIRRALLLSLGEFDEKAFSVEARLALRAQDTRDVSHGYRPGCACVGGMAAPAVAAERMAQAGQRGMGQGQGATGQASAKQSAASGEGPREEPAAVVRQRAGTDHGDHSGAGGLRDRIAHGGSRS